MKTIEKKDYQAPEVNVIMVQQQTKLLAGSGEATKPDNDSRSLNWEDDD